MLLTSKVSLKFATASKRRKIAALLTNAYIPVIWTCPAGCKSKEAGILAGQVKVKIGSKLAVCAYRQATSICYSTKEAAKEIGIEPSTPIFDGSAVLQKQLLTIRPGKGMFDLFIAVPSLRQYKTIKIPVKKTKHLNKLLAIPGAIFKQNIILNENWIALTVDVPDVKLKSDGKIIGVDVGQNKLLADSDGNFYGAECRQVCKNVWRKKSGSNAKRRAMTTRNHFFNRVVKQLPWSELKTLVIEDLTGMKKGKNKKRSKEFRRKTAPWSYRQVKTRIEQKAAMNGVQLQLVSPRYTSQMCPKCGRHCKENRSGERFQCVSCGHTADSDANAAINILRKWQKAPEWKPFTSEFSGSLHSPELQKQ
jgi:IS605 OrfB family transposase